MVSDLVGLAIGRDGHNVNEVRKLDGILSVEFEDYNQMFRVRAKVGFRFSPTLGVKFGGHIKFLAAGLRENG